MEKSILKQYDITRSFFLMGAEKITEENADIIPNGYPNSLRWQLGHVYVSLEFFAFRLAGEDVHIPEGYNEMFARGTSPEEWTTEPPKVDELKGLLSEQKERLLKTFEGRLEEKLSEPFKAGPFQLDTVGEVILFALHHESEHIGVIKGLKNGINGQ
ncbi:DinB family protein [Halobacillus yeomjeoni]|uniref:DinB family protein n=1 Tax=Halobacillus yeomjeoni TaxID=311194 RepID=A0A931HTA5_9BACI|nr:DinB family protein [Halobacillus yeomjeoni]MBH0229180.1 DinB family protein [Halobacillus yeomjeoni]